MMRRMGALLAAGLIVASLAAPISAQENRESRNQAPPAVKLKSEGTAMTLAVVGSLVPWALLFSTFSTPELEGARGYLTAIMIPIGPSLGYFYAGAAGRGLLSTGIRVGVICGLVALGTSLHDAGHDSTSALVACGVIAIAGSYVIDIGGIRKAVQRHNLKAQRLQLALAPLVSPRTRAFGLQALLSF